MTARCRYMILILLIFYQCTYLCAEEIIWQIGREDGLNSEFDLAQGMDDMSILYNIPSDWANMIEDTENIWEGFYGYLYPPGFILPPQEIRIQFDYTSDYPAPILCISAAAHTNDIQRLVVSMSDPNQLIDPNYTVTVKFEEYRFPLYAIREGIHEDNIIIIKNMPLSSTGVIQFDYLRLISGDSDGDGALDEAEPEGDMDNDTIENSKDPDTASMLLRDDDYLLFDLQEDEEGEPYFKGLQTLDLEDISHPIPPGQFFCYGLFQLTIEGLSEGEEYMLTICDPNRLYPFASFFIYKESEGFKRTETSINDECISIRIKPIYDQQEIICGLSYPTDPQRGINEANCFINALLSASSAH